MTKVKPPRVTQFPVSVKQALDDKLNEMLRDYVAPPKRVWLRSHAVNPLKDGTPKGTPGRAYVTEFVATMNFKGRDWNLWAMLVASGDRVKE